MEKITTKEVYRKLEDNTMELVSSEEITIEVPSNEDQIADKEAELLKVYAELEELKNSK